jgi:hypothetical protein
VGGSGRTPLGLPGKQETGSRQTGLRGPGESSAYECHRETTTTAPVLDSAHLAISVSLGGPLNDEAATGYYHGSVEFEDDAETRKLLDDAYRALRTVTMHYFSEDAGLFYSPAEPAVATKPEPEPKRRTIGIPFRTTKAK